MGNHILIRDRSFLFPILIGVVSLIGTGFLLVQGLFPMQGTQPIPTRTATPFKYLLLATETMISTPTPEVAETTELPFAPTEISDIASPDGAITPFSKASTQNEVSTEEIFTPTVTITPNPVFNDSEPMKAGTYDGADSHIIHEGNWSSQNNVEAADGKLLVSNTVSNYVAFRFTGYQMGLGYQSSDTAGTVTINIDGTELTITQLVGNLWISEEFTPGTHYVTITHASGSQVNLDYIEIPE